MRRCGNDCSIRTDELVRKSKSSLGKDPVTQDKAGERLVRRLIRSRQPRGAGRGDAAAWAEAAACGDLYRDLSQWVGTDGCHALFSRALAQSRKERAALELIRLSAGSEPYADGVAESLKEHGDEATAEALEVMLVRLVELLERLVGDEMAMKLIERSFIASEGAGATPEDIEEEA